MLSLLKHWFFGDCLFSDSVADDVSAPRSPTRVNQVPIYTDIPIATHYRFKERIGCGSYGQVFAAEPTSAAVQRRLEAVAIKVIPSSDASKKEVDILCSLNHPNIVATFAVYKSKRTYIVMERYDGGELFDRIINQGHFEEKEAARFTRQLLVALCYLHERGIAHCDIKPSNVLLLSSELDELKLVDFGAAQRIGNKLLSAQCGSMAFMAPEVIVGTYNEQCDLWSLGVVVYCMLFGYNPFDPCATQNAGKITALILKGFQAEIHKGFGAFFPATIPVSDMARDFITGLLTSDWRQRLTVREAAAHAWIN